MIFTDINKEISKITEFQNSSLPLQDRKTSYALDLKIQQICNDYENNNYDFSGYKNINKKQYGKIRHAKTYEPFSSEEILCIYIKRTLDKKFHIKYPNRNEYMHSLFDTINALRNMNDFSIFKFDFKHFFDTISGEYVFKKYLSKASLERYQIALLEDFVTKTKYTYAGLNTSNIICEIAAKHFDEILSLKLKNHGLIFYRRYIDDGILIFNKRVGEDFCLSIINSAIQEVFFDKSIEVEKKCKTRLNDSKQKYISVHYLAMSGLTDDFDFLGYKFILIPKINSANSKIKTEFKYGITTEKIDKYTKRIDDIVNEYKTSRDMELLRHQIKAFTHRTVYQLPKYKTFIWKAKGFIANYQELRYRLDLLDEDTKNFLENAVENAFKKNNEPIPYFLKGKKEESVYNLYNNMKNYKTLLLVEPIGISKTTLNKMCKQIGIQNNSKEYNRLVRDYLVKVKVGY